MKQIIVIFLCFIIGNLMVNSQNLSKLSNLERNNKVIEIAKAEYSKERYKGYFREYGTPIVSKHQAKGNAPIKSSFYKALEGDIYYIVEFGYDKNKYRFEYNYAAKVYVWEKTGEAFHIELGGGYGLNLKKK